MCALVEPGSETLVTWWRNYDMRYRNLCRTDIWRSANFAKGHAVVHLRTSCDMDDQALRGVRLVDV